MRCNINRLVKTCLRITGNPGQTSGLLLLLLAGCAGASNHTAQISGYVLPSADFPSGDIIDVRVALLDVSKMDVAATVLSETETRIKPGWPLRYSLSYDPSLLDPRMTYGMSVRVSDKQGRLLAINDTAHQFGKNSDADQFDVLIKPVKARVSTLAELKINCAEMEYRIYVYKNFLVRYNSKTMSRQIFFQQRAASGSRYTRDAESLWLKGNNPPLYFISDEKTKCNILNTG